MKTCKKCKISKELSEFYQRKNGKYYGCRQCVREKTKEYKMEHKDYYSKYNKQYRIDNQEKLDSYTEVWKKNNEDILKEKRRLKYQLNSEVIKKKNYEYSRNKKLTNPLYKLTLGIRSLILLSFKSKFTIKAKRTTEILGCSFEEFKSHLENQFDDKMSWENQGSYWHMDHIKPISLATTEQEVYELNHYTNFQPLYWADNLSKGNRY